MSRRPSLTAVGGRTGSGSAADTQEAAEYLRRLLDALTPTGTTRDRRVRQAMTAAAAALSQDQDPLAAAEAVYAELQP